MKRLALVLLGSLALLPAARGQTDNRKKATVAYLQALQTKGGGFYPSKRAAGPASRASLRATTAAVRALKYSGGRVNHPDVVAAFVRDCFVKSSGGFVDSPHLSSPDVITTAVGLMAVVELKMPRERYVGPAVRYLGEHARTFEEIRMAAAGLEAVGKRSDRARDWLGRIARTRHRDGTYGKGDGTARATGSAVVTVLRLGGKVGHRDRVVKALREGQRSDGGFGKEGAAASDLETCYRVTRAFHMLKEKPADVAALRRFVARCRNADGGYGVAPGQPSGAAGTYFASIIRHWLGER